MRAIYADNLRKVFGDFVAVNNISFEVAEGEILDRKSTRLNSSHL